MRARPPGRRASWRLLNLEGPPTRPTWGFVTVVDYVAIPIGGRLMTLPADRPSRTRCASPTH